MRDARQDARHDTRVSSFGRRNFLRTAGAASASLTVAASASVSAAGENYDVVVDVVEEGADDTGREPINPVLDDLREDSVLVRLPEGEYAMDRQFRHTGFDAFGLVGDDATIVPAPAGRWNGLGRRLFKLGTYASPGDRLRIEGLTFDYTAPNTGLRAIQAQAADPRIRDVNVVGRHDTGNWAPGPLLVDVTDPDGTGSIERVDLRGGGVMDTRSVSGSLGPIGFTVTPYHRGTLHVNRCRVYRFPSNGFYCSAEEGRVVIREGRYRNNNVANIRLSGRGSEVRGAHVVVRDSPEGWDGQTGIRLDGGGGYRLRDVELWTPWPNASGVRIRSDAESTRIEGSLLTYGPGKGDAVFVEGGSGPVTVVDTEIRKRGPGQAIQIQGGIGSGPVVVEEVEIEGDAPGGDGGCHAIRCERAGCKFRGLRIDQPGDDYRRCLAIDGDDCLVVGGRYTSTHHPIVVTANGATIENVEARAENGSAGIKVYGGYGDVQVVDSRVWNGIENHGSAVVTSGNDYPST